MSSSSEDAMTTAVSRATDDAELRRLLTHVSATNTPTTAVTPSNSRYAITFVVVACVVTLLAMFGAVVITSAIPAVRAMPTQPPLQFASWTAQPPLTSEASDILSVAVRDVPQVSSYSSAFGDQVTVAWVNSPTVTDGTADIPLSGEVTRHRATQCTSPDPTVTTVAATCVTFTPQYVAVVIWHASATPDYAARTTQFLADMAATTPASPAR